MGALATGTVEVFVVLTALVCAVVAGDVAYKKGYSSGWAVVGLLLGPMGVLWAGFLPDQATRRMLAGIFAHLTGDKVLDS